MDVKEKKIDAFFLSFLLSSFFCRDLITRTSEKIYVVVYCKSVDVITLKNSPRFMEYEMRFLSYILFQIFFSVVRVA